MKNLIVIFLASTGLICGQVFESAPKTGIMTAEEFRAQATVANTGAKTRELAEAAFRSGDMELVKACFNAPGMFGSFVRKLEELPEGDFKTKVVLNILTEEWPYDEEPNGMRPPLTPPPFGLEEICLSVFARMLPDAGLVIDDPKLRDRKSRTELARMLEDKLSRSEQRRQDNEDSKRIPKNSDESRPSGTQVQPSPVARPPAPKAADQKQLPLTWQQAAVAVVVVLGLLWLLLKKRK